MYYAYSKVVDMTLKEPTNLSLNIKLKERADKAVKKGLFYKENINSLTGLVEAALVEKLDRTKGA